MIGHRRSIGEIAFLLRRTPAALEEKVREIGLQLPREFDTRFFFRKGVPPVDLNPKKTEAELSDGPLESGPAL